MSASSPVAPGDANAPSTPDTAMVADSSYRNPSYPPRVHQNERAQLEVRLKACDDRLASMRRKLGTLGAHHRRADYERIYHQMNGARDQIADAIRRMPLETGTLYEEDRERLQAAEAAVGWLAKRWDQVVV